MRILITGANGFIGKNLQYALQNHKYSDILLYNSSMGVDILEKYCQTCEYVFHLAGVNRPQKESDYEIGNAEFTRILVLLLEKYKNTAPIMYASSMQAELENPYGRSKRKAEQYILEHGDTFGVRILIYRFPNVFGKWCKPNYNSVIATFCYNCIRGLPITVNDPVTVMNLVYIDDVIKELLQGISGNETRQDNMCFVPVFYKKMLGEIAKRIELFSSSRSRLDISNQKDDFLKKLYSTYLSYLPKSDFKYALKSHVDQRGSFTEFIKTKERGQISVNVSKPHIIKGNHWHNTKHEKFLVVSGTGIIRFRKVYLDEIVEIHVSGDKLEVVDIPPGYTHNIENAGECDMVTVMWANEVFDEKNPDTYYLEV